MFLFGLVSSLLHVLHLSTCIFLNKRYIVLIKSITNIVGNLIQTNLFLVPSYHNMCYQYLKYLFICSLAKFKSFVCTSVLLRHHLQRLTSCNIDLTCLSDHSLKHHFPEDSSCAKSKHLPYLFFSANLNKWQIVCVVCSPTLLQ